MYSISLVVPVYNEDENIQPLLEEVHAAMAQSPYPWDLILVDDGSTDMTVQKMNEGVAQYGAHVKVIELQRNFGQTAAMQAGFDHAVGDVVVTLDADLQNDPADILRLVDTLIVEGLDLVVGWRKNRQDNAISRTIPSRIANKLIGKITGVVLHDYGCSLKAYRNDVLRNINLYGEMHRFIPAWLAMQTSVNRIKEVVVNHRARVRGVSKYGIGRTSRVITDLLSVYFFQRFLSRPSHFFGKFAFYLGVLGFSAFVYLCYVKFVEGLEIGHRPLLLISIVTILVSIQFLMTGILAELLTRTYFSADQNKSYRVRGVRGKFSDVQKLPISQA